MAIDHLRFHRQHHHTHSAFGGSVFGRQAEAFARFFGTPGYLIGQTLVVLVWVAVNVVGAVRVWDPYPFILLNLVFSLQAAYAAPLILLAQTRQADRERVLSEADAQHREALSLASLERNEIALKQGEVLKELLLSNTNLTEQVEQLTREMHRRVCAGEHP